MLLKLDDFPLQYFTDQALNRFFDDSLSEAVCQCFLYERSKLP